MTRLPTLREFRKAYKEKSLVPAAGSWIPGFVGVCPIGVKALQAGVVPEVKHVVAWADRTYGKWIRIGFTGGFDGCDARFVTAPAQHHARYLAAYRYGRRVRRALIGGDK